MIAVYIFCIDGKVRRLALVAQRNHGQLLKAPQAALCVERDYHHNSLKRCQPGISCQDHRQWGDAHREGRRFFDEPAP